jgi:hypothetical protein
MKRLLTVIIVVISFIILNGCGASRMALSKGQDRLDVSAKSIVLATVKISNQNKPGYQPTLYSVLFDANSAGAETADFVIWEDPHKSEKDRYNEYLLSFSLKPGSYNFRFVGCTYHVPIVIAARCEIPLNSTIEIKANSVVYLGNIDAIIRERKKDEEERAGPLLFAIDQAVAGFSTGTFDVIFTDKYDDDMVKFRTEYPVLKTVKIDKSILPPWIRPENIKKK